MTNIAPVAQWIERPAPAGKVEGSNPFGCIGHHDGSRD